MEGQEFSRFDYQNQNVALKGEAPPRGVGKEEWVCGLLSRQLQYRKGSLSFIRIIKEEPRELRLRKGAENRAPSTSEQGRERSGLCAEI